MSGERDYSSKTVIQKIGIKPNQRILLINPPKDFIDLLVDLPEGISFNLSLFEKADYIHIFVTEEQELLSLLDQVKPQLSNSGMLWISNPKKDSKIVSDLNQSQIQVIGLKAGLVDVKVCSINNNWSAMKFVYRLVDR